MKKLLKYQTIKNIVLLIHIIFIFIMAVGFFLSYTNYNFGKGFIAMNKEDYEDSPLFISSLEEDIKRIFFYERYKHFFETKGKFDPSLKIFSITKDLSKEETYIIEDVLKYAKEKGIYLDKEFDISSFSESNKKNDEKEYTIEWRSYEKVKPLETPGDSYVTFDGINLEVLELIAEYNNAYNSLKKKKRNIYYYLDYEDYKVFNASVDYIKKLGKTIFIDSESINTKTNLSIIPSNLHYEVNKGLYNEKEDELINENYKIYIGVDTNYTNEDSYFFENIKYRKERTKYSLGINFILFSLVGAFLTLLILIRVTGKKSLVDREVNLNILDNQSFEFRVFLGIILSIGLLQLNQIFIYRLVKILFVEEMWNYADEIVKYIALYLIFLFIVLSMVRSIKKGVFWKNSIIKHILDENGFLKTNNSFVNRFTINKIFYYIINLLLIIIIAYYFKIEDSLVDRFVLVFFISSFIILNLVVLYRKYRREIDLDRISEYIAKINSDNEKEYLDIESFKGKEKELAKRVYEIGKDLETAINERVKSEKLKANLITNVSHDLKTPLTSIINYIDLIKREEFINDNISKYIDILEEKSLRLKNLTDELLEASKVSSGNVLLDLKQIDLVQIVKQVNAEFEDRYRDKGIEIIFSAFEDKVLVKADGNHLWRVFENIYTNVEKYSVENSRVYIEIIKTDKIIFTMKNISKYPLNISASELQMRFVRGDSSRSTSGSGLGLSIARSLIELQKAKMFIDIDGDLFKVNLYFSILDEYDF